MIYLSIYLHVNFRTECVTLKNSLCIFYGTLLSGSLLCLITERKLNFNYFNPLKNSLCIFYGTLLSGLITERKLNFNYFNRLKPT